MSGLSDMEKILLNKNNILNQADIRHIISLISDEEIARHSGQLADALHHRRMSEMFSSFPVPPEGDPHPMSQYTNLLHRTAEELKNGRSALVFCSSGMRRSRRFSKELLIILGYSAEQAQAKVFNTPIAGENNI